MRFKTTCEKNKTLHLFAICGLYICVSEFYFLLYQGGIPELYVSEPLLIVMGIIFASCTFFAACASAEMVQRLNSKKNRIIKNQSGWMLVDLMIAVVLLGVAGTAILFMYQQNTRANTVTTNHNYAIALAQQSLENIKKYDGTATILSLPSEVLNPPDVTKNQIKYTVKVEKVTVSGIPAKMYPYSATVTWKDGQGNHDVGSLPPVKIIAYYFSN